MAEYVQVRFDEVERLTVIPAVRRGRSIGFSTWDDTVDAVRAFVHRQLSDPSRIVGQPKAADCDALIPVLVSLYPRPDNDYDQRAISVAAPPRHGGTLLDRHLGYLYTGQLYRLGPSIQALAACSPAPIGCHGWIELHELSDDEDDLNVDYWKPTRDQPFSRVEAATFGYSVGRIRLLLPEAEDLARLVDTYRKSIGSRGPARVGSGDKGTSRLEAELRQAQLGQLAGLIRNALMSRVTTGVWGRETARSRAQTRRDDAADKQNQAWAEYRLRPHGRTSVAAVTRAPYGTPRVVVVDGNGAELGEWHLPDGPLTLVDERVREDARVALVAHGFRNVPQPDIGQMTDLPDATVVIKGSTWSIRTIEQGVVRSCLPEIARYDSDSRVLVVYAKPHVEPARVLLRRHGADPTRVSWADPGTDIVEHNGRAGQPWTLAGPQRFKSLRLLRRVRRFLPQEHSSCLTIIWIDESKQCSLADLPSDSLLADSRVHRMAGADMKKVLRPERCRLCGKGTDPTAKGNAYCLGCWNMAQYGALRDCGTDGPWTKSAIWALRRLADVEFSGPPALPQLRRLTVTDPDLADELMLCRFLVPRPELGVVAARHQRATRTWTEWLALAGLLDDGFRTARGTVSVATDGHLCRSMLERHVDDFLHHWGIEHSIEPHYPHHPRLNATGLRADWRLADGTFVEALGLMDEQSYSKKVSRKRELAHIAGIPLLTLCADDLNRLPEIFAPWLPDRR